MLIGWRIRLKFSEFVISKLHFFLVEVPTEAEGYLVFDTTNTRGLRLTPSEQLKARLASIAREDANLAQDLIEQWNRAASRLEMSGLPLNAMDDYLRIIWSSQHGHIKKQDLASIADKFLDSQTKCNTSRVVAPLPPAWRQSGYPIPLAEGGRGEPIGRLRRPLPRKTRTSPKRPLRKSSNCTTIPPASASARSSAGNEREFVNSVENCCESYLAVVVPKGNSPLAADLEDLPKLNVQKVS